MPTPLTLSPSAKHIAFDKSPRPDRPQQDAPLRHCQRGGRDPVQDAASKASRMESPGTGTVLMRVKAGMGRGSAAVPSTRRRTVSQQKKEAIAQGSGESRFQVPRRKIPVSRRRVQARECCGCLGRQYQTAANDAASSKGEKSVVSAIARRFSSPVVMARLHPDATIMPEPSVGACARSHRPKQPCGKSVWQKRPPIAVSHPHERAV